MSYFSDLHELTGFRDVTSVNILNFRTKIYPLSSKITRNGVGFNISVGIWKSAEKVVKLYALTGSNGPYTDGKKTEWITEWRERSRPTYNKH